MKSSRIGIVIGLVNLLVLLTVAGCGSATTSKRMEYESAGHKDKAADDFKAEKVAFQKDGQAPPAGKQQGEKIERKIIYTAQLRLITENLEKAQKKLAELIKQHKGFIAESTIHGSTGAQRTGVWKIRVPVENFDDLQATIADLGVPEENGRRSQEVTEEFYDLQARIKNAKRYEQTLLKLLDEKAKKLQEHIDVRKEIKQAREDIERMEGKLRVLVNLTSLSTINLTIIERKGYVPPQAPTFGTTIGRTYQGSFDALVTFGQTLVLVFVAVLPWLVVLLIVAVPCWFLLRMWWRRMNAPVQVIAVPPAGNGSTAGET